MSDTVELISAKEVLRLTGYKSRTTIWRRVKAGDFPSPIALSRQTTRWKKTEIEAWVAGLPKLTYGRSE